MIAHLLTLLSGIVVGGYSILILSRICDGDKFDQYRAEIDYLRERLERLTAIEAGLDMLATEAERREHEVASCDYLPTNI